MSVLRRATEQDQSDWRPCPEGLWRWEVGKPGLDLSPTYGKWNVKFPLKLTPAEQAHLEREQGKPPEGIMQSWTSNYMTGLSLGYMKQGAYVSTKLIDFLACCLGTAQIKSFRGWVSNGGGPPRPDDKDDAKAEMALIAEWLEWWEGLEVYGSIRHEPDKNDPNQVWGRFGGPMPVGSLPGQPDPDYQAHGRGKLRAMLIAAGVQLPPARSVAAEIVAAQPELVAAAPVVEAPRTYEQAFGILDGTDELPW